MEETSDLTALTPLDRDWRVREINKRSATREEATGICSVPQGFRRGSDGAMLRTRLHCTSFVECVRRADEIKIEPTARVGSIFMAPATGIEPITNP